MNLSQVTEPAAEPLEVADVRAHQKLPSGMSDAQVSQLIRAARRRVETFTRRRLITQTVRLSMDGFPSVVHVPLAPVQSVDQITYLDGAGVTQTLSSSLYRLATSTEPPRIAPVYGQTWPVPRYELDTVKIDLIVGYGADADAVPEDIQQAMQLLIGHMFEQTSAVTAEAMHELPWGVSDMLLPYVVWV